MRRMRLSVKLPLLIVVTAVVVICIITLLSLFLIRNNVRETETDALTNNVHGYASAIDFYLNEARSIIEITAQQEEMTEFRLPPLNAPATEELPADTHVPLHNIATSILQNSKVFEYLMFLNPDGSVHLLEPHELQSQLSRHDLAFTDWYWKLIETKQTVVSDLHVSTATQRPTVVVATPVRSPDGRLIGIWAGGLKLEALSQLGMARSQTGPPERYGYVTDSRGLIIAHQGNPKYVQEQTDFSSVPPVQAALTGRQGTMQYISPIDGLEKLAAYMPFPNTHWAVVYVVPTQIAFAPIYQLTRYIGLIGLLAIIVMGLGGLAIARQVTKPLERLTEGAISIGAGNLSQRIKVATGDEIGQLATEFNRMAASLSDKEAQLREYTATLEQKVEKRTRELQESEERFRLAAESCTDLIYEWDLGTRVNWFGNVDELLGYAPAKFPRTLQAWADIIHPEDRERAMTAIDRQMKGEAPYDIEYRVKKRDGTYNYWWARGTVRRDMAGKPQRWIGSVTDITERKRAEEALVASEARYRRLFESTRDGILILDANTGKVIAVNSFLIELLRYSEEEFIGKELWDIGLFQNIAASRAAFLKLQDKGYIRYENLPLETKDGRRIEVEFVSHVYMANKAKVMQCNIRDITDRKKAEEELKKTMAELERSNAELERFAYVASHDLQEPLRMVSSYTQLLEKRYKDKLDADAHEFIDYAVGGAKRMQNLINDLLAYSRVGTRGKPFEPTDCEAVLDATLANLDVAISSSKAKVTHDPLPTVMADEGQLVQLFQNLVDNAIKFHGKKPPRVHISAELKDSEWVFSVKDNGIGIDPQYFDRIFIVFQRLHREEEYKGTGIGLAVALRIVRRHGGRMWIESQPGKGSTFFFTLPGKGEISVARDSSLVARDDR